MPRPATTTPPSVSLRVLWLIKGLGPGGAERLLVHQAASAGPDVSYEAAYLMAAKDQLVAELTAHGVPVTCWQTRSAFDPRWVIDLRRRLGRGDLDIVHVHSPMVAGIARLVVRSVPRARRPALVYTEHNRWGQYSSLTRWLNRLTYGLDDWQIAVSDGVRDSISSRRRGRVDTIVHGIDLAAAEAHVPEREQVRSEWAVEADTVVVGTVANLRVEKGYADLVRAAAMVPGDLPVVFVAIGQGPLAGEIATQVARSGLGDRFRLLGFRPDALRLMAGFDLFVLASHHEGLPVAVMEAQALGLPVVATRVGGLPEAVEHGVSGTLVAPGDPRGLADAIVAVARDSQRRRDMGDAARRTAVRFDRNRSTRQIEHGYRRVMGAR